MTRVGRAARIGWAGIRGALHALAPNGLFGLRGFGSLYRAAGVGHRFRDLFAPRTGPTTTIVLAADALRNRTRAVVRNSGFARNIVETLVANIAGTGFTPNPLFGAGDEGEAANASGAWVREARLRFRRWAADADADGGTFEDLLSAAVRGMIEGGDAFVVRVAGASAGVPLQLRVYEAELVPLWKNEMLLDGGIVRAGIEFDQDGRVRAYWFYPYHPGEFSLVGKPDLPLVRVPAENVLHFFRRTRPGQVRGEPWLAPVLLRLHDLEGYADAETVRKRCAANFVFTLEVADPLGIDNAVGEAHNKAARDGIVNTEPGSVVPLGIAEKMNLLAPADVGPNFSAFFVAILREICAGPGVPYAIATGDMSQETYTSHRAGLLEFRRRVEAIQYNLIAHRLRTLWGWFLDDAVAANVLQAPRYIQWREDYLDCDWVPPGWDWVDPQKEVLAKGDELALMLTSRTRIAAGRGEDFADIVRELQQEKALIHEAGLQDLPPQLSTRSVQQAQPAADEVPPTPRTGTNG